jgi:hypothetical protein
VDDIDLARARKVHALILRGATDGERAAAKNRFGAIALRCNVTFSDLEYMISHGMSQRPSYVPIDPVFAKKRRGLKPDFEWFKEEYRISRGEFGLGIWVPARLMAMSGWILWELTKVGYAERNEDCFKPGR